MAKSALRFREVAGIAARKLVVWISGAETDVSSSPVITAGAGAASAADANGSLRLRTNGIPEYRVGAAWEGVAVLGQTPDFESTGVKADIVAESTADTGVTIDGALVKDAHILDSVGFYDAAAPTKIARVDAGGVTAGNTRVLSMADEDVDLAATLAADTDGEIGIPVTQGLGDGGTFTATVAAGLEAVTRTAANTTESWWVPVPVPNRTTASRGIMPTGMTVNYSCDTAVADDVRFEIWKVTQAADGSAATAAVLFGEDNADYDADHNTAAKRGDNTAGPELHKATLTDAGTPAYMGAGETLLLRFYVDGEVGGASVQALNSAVLQYTQNPLDR